MEAEAKVRNGEDGSAELNAIRERVGMPRVEANLDNILKERLLELCVGRLETAGPHPIREIHQGIRPACTH